MDRPNCFTCKYNGLYAPYHSLNYCAVNPSYYEHRFEIKDSPCLDWEQITLDLAPSASIWEWLDAPAPNNLKAEAIAHRFSSTEITATLDFLQRQIRKAEKIAYRPKTITERFNWKLIAFFYLSLAFLQLLYVIFLAINDSVAANNFANNIFAFGAYIFCGLAIVPCACLDKIATRHLIARHLAKKQLYWHHERSYLLNLSQCYFLLGNFTRP